MRAHSFGVVVVVCLNWGAGPSYAQTADELSTQFEESGYDPSLCLKWANALHDEGRTKEALSALDACEAVTEGELAGRAVFNRGVIKFASGDYAGAEKAFGQVSDMGTPISPLGTINAGHAAIARKKLRKGLSWDAKAREQDDGGLFIELRQELGADLVALTPEKHEAKVVAHYEAEPIVPGRAEGTAELLYAVAMAFYERERYVAAAKLFDRAAAAKPSGPRSFMLGRAQIASDDYEAGRASLAKALEQDLPDDAKKVAKKLTTASAAEPTASAVGARLSVSAVTGYDSNVPYSAATTFDFLPTTINSPGAPFMAVIGNIGWGYSLSKMTTFDTGYSLAQTHYFRKELDFFRQQAHDGYAKLTFVTGKYTIELQGLAELLFVSVRDVVPAYIGGAVSLAGSRDMGDLGVTSAAVSIGARGSLDDAYVFVKGPRIEARVRHTMTSSDQRYTAAAELAYRDERTGEQSIEDVLLDPNRPLLTSTYVIRHGHWAPRLSLYGTARRGRYAAFAELGIERRRYHEPSFIETTGLMGQPLTRANQETRLDVIGYGSLEVRAAVFDYFIGLGYDLFRSASNVDSSVNPLDYDNKNFWKHVVRADVTYTFW